MDLATPVPPSPEYSSPPSADAGNNKLANHAVANPVLIQVANKGVDEVANQVVDKVATQVADNVADEVANQVADEITDQVADEIEDQVADEVADQVADEVADQVADEVADQVADRVVNQAAIEAGNQVADDVVNQVANQITKQVVGETIDAGARDAAPRAVPIAPRILPGSSPLSASRASRATQVVTTLADRRRLAEWMSGEVVRSGTERHIASKAVREYPELFPGNSKANLMRATRIWRQRAELLRDGIASAVTPVPLMVGSRVQKHSLPGRGRKRAPWSDKLQTDLLTEYNRLKSAGYVFTPRSVRSVAVALLECKKKEGYATNMKDLRSERPLIDCLTARWVRSFADRWQVTLDERPLRENVPHYKKRQIELDEMLIAYHLGTLSRELSEGKLRDEEVEAVVPIHFLHSTTTGTTLGFGEEELPEFDEMVDGARPLTMLLRVSGGKNGKVEAPFMIFQDVGYAYPMPGVGDDVAGVMYRTSPSGWMDGRVLGSFFRETSSGGRRVVYVEASTWAMFAKELVPALTESRTELRFLPGGRGGGGETQAVEMGIRAAVQERWRAGWEEMKRGMVDVGVWDVEGRDSSGLRFNAGPRFFLKLAAMVVEKVNGICDAEGVGLGKRAMIRTGLSCGEEGRWETGQLGERLMKVVEKHRRQFEGEMVTKEAHARVVAERVKVESEAGLVAAEVAAKAAAAPMAGKGVGRASVEVQGAGREVGVGVGVKDGMEGGGVKRKRPWKSVGDGEVGEGKRREESGSGGVVSQVGPSW